MADTYQYIVNRSHDFITLIDRDYRYAIVNDAYCRAIEHPREQILDHTVAEVWGQDRFETEIKPRLDECFAGSEVHFVDEFRFGSMRKSLHVSFYPYREDGADPEDPPTHALVFSHDITYLAEVESRLARYEYRDPTTGLHNRHALEEMLDTEFGRSGREDEPRTKALLFISLPGFRKINQTHGHHIGDLLLEHTANRIREAIRSSDVVFRFDGTSLAVLLTNVPRPTDAAVVAQKIADDVGVPYQYRESVITIESYIGISLHPGDAGDRESILEHASASSVTAEERGIDFLFYDEQMHDEAVSRMSTLGDLHAAISDGGLELYYHPIIGSGESGPAVVGAEALIRWKHPERGILEPDDFIDLAEGSRLIAAIDKWALFRALEQLAAWLANYDLFVSINVSAHEFKDGMLPDIVRNALRQHADVDPHRLKLELTESRSMANPASSITQMEELREIGVDVWIDDFGTGQSSLAYLKRLPATTMKMDRGLVEGIDERDNDRRYLAGIVESIRARGKAIVAEGVLNEAQERIVGELGCELVQGYHYARPMTADDFARVLASGIDGRAAGCRSRS